MRSLLVATASLILVSGHAIEARAQEMFGFRVGTPSDTARVWTLPGLLDRRPHAAPLWTPETVIGRRQVAEPSFNSSLSCPMWTFVPSGDSSAGMPVVRPGTETAPMPTVRTTCANPLAAKVDR